MEKFYVKVEKSCCLVPAKREVHVCAIYPKIFFFEYNFNYFSFMSVCEVQHLRAHWQLESAHIQHPDVADTKQQSVEC